MLLMTMPVTATTMMTKNLGNYGKHVDDRQHHAGWDVVGPSEAGISRSSFAALAQSSRTFVTTVLPGTPGTYSCRSINVNRGAVLMEGGKAAGQVRSSAANPTCCPALHTRSVDEVSRSGQTPYQLRRGNRDRKGRKTVADFQHVAG